VSGPEPTHSSVLCALADLAETGAKGVLISHAGGRSDIVVVQHRDGALAYENRCPHQGTPLEITPDRFLDRQRRTILCSTHGARFRLADGFCYSGPCQGQMLTPVAIRIVAGRVALAERGETQAQVEPT